MKTFRSTGIIANYHKNFFEKRKELRKKAKNNYSIWYSPAESENEEQEDLFKSYFKNNLYYNVEE